jgi:hypothetical protein
LKILSFLDSDVREQSYKPQKHELLPRVEWVYLNLNFFITHLSKNEIYIYILRRDFLFRFTRYLREESPLKFFSRNELEMLETVGYIIKDHFLNQSQLISDIFKEVFIHFIWFFFVHSFSFSFSLSLSLSLWLIHLFSLSIY